MDQGLAVVLPLLLFAIFDLFIIYNVYKCRNNAYTRSIFLVMSAANFVQQLCGAVSYLFDYHMVSAPAAVQNIMYLCMFTAMAVTGFEWFMYLRMMLAGKQDLSKGVKILLQTPVTVIFWLTAVSPWTHWIFWINADGVYRRGTLYFLQYACSYIYVILAIAAMIFYRKRSISVYRKKVYSNFIMFILPAILGSILQLYVFAGGYSMIGMSLAIAFLYLDLYVDEVNENQRLQLEAQEYIVVDALSASYLNVYIIDTAMQTVKILKLNGYVTRGLSKDKTGPYPYEATCRTYISNRVYSEDQQMVADLMSLDNLLLQMKEKKEYEFTYRVPENGGLSYYQGKYVAVDEKYIVCGFQNVDEIVKKEKEQKEELQEKLRINAALSQEYTGIFMINCDDGSMKVLKLDGNQNAVSMINADISYDDFRKKYLLCFALPEYSADVIRLSELPNLIRYFKDGHKDLLVKYRTKPNQAGQTNFELYVVPFLNGDNNQIIFGCRCIDALISKEAEYNRRLTEAKEVAEKHNIELKNQLDIIGGLTNAVIVCSAYNLITKEIIHVKELPEVHALLKSCCSPQEAFDTFLSVGVAAEDLPAMKEFVDINTVPERLKDRDVISAEFRKLFPKQGWNRASWILADRDEHGNAHKVLYIVEEITDSVLERKKQEADLKQARDEAQAANAAKTSFLFNMSHDIRTPMNAIMGFRDLLEKYQEDPEKRRDYLSKIQDSSTVLLSIINNVLEMARIEKGTPEIEETAWSAEQFNDTLYSVFHVMMAEKGLNFTRQIEVQHHYVYCDPTKLREIFINILSNAYKYTNASGSVNMHLEEIPSNREGWVLYQTTISDTGIGMSEEFLPHIFEEFSREQNTTDAKVEGTGLGMPIVKRLVEMLDGTIEVKSKKGEGSTFIVTIPHRIADKTNLVDHAGIEIDPKLFEGKHILLAEDNDLNAEIAIEILEEAGFKVDRAEDGAACVDMLKKAEAGHYDLILMDIQMPNMNGYEATKAIRQLEDSRKASIKILAMTANAFEEDRREALRAGMNGHLAKPINVKELMKTLAGILE